MGILQKILSILFLGLIYCGTTFANQDTIVVPDDISWTERFILSEIKELRITQETLKRELFQEVHDREIEVIDKALGYSANTVNFFFVVITILVMGFGIVGWRTLGDLKRSTKESMDRETKKIISNFQKQIAELEREQKINIFWRQFNLAESDQEKMTILDKIHHIKPDSKYVIIERGNTYLSMGLFDQVIDVVESIINGDKNEHMAHALYIRSCAYAGLGDITSAAGDIKYLLQISPEYKEIILESEYLEKYIKNSTIKSLLK